MTSDGAIRTGDPAPRCPLCSAADPLPIVYGYPDPEHIRAALRGEIALGGEVHAGARPAFECRREHCGHTFDRDSRTSAD